MSENAATLIFAGSETTATTLSGVTYLLAMNPEKHSKLKDEIRSSFMSEHEIDVTNTKLPYLQAVLNEGLRLYPAVPGSSMRKVLKGPPAIISGFEIPQNVSTGLCAIFSPPLSAQPADQSTMIIRPLWKPISGLYFATQAALLKPKSSFPSVGSVPTNASPTTAWMPCCPSRLAHELVSDGSECILPFSPCLNFTPLNLTN